MIIEIIPCLNNNYSYLIFDKKTNTVSIIDPSEFNNCDDVVRKYKRLDYILNTHHHADHVGGNLKLKQKYNSKILGFNLDKDRIPGIDVALKENQKNKIGNLEFETIFTPGHTSGHITLFFYREGVVFTGDTLFSLGCGAVFEGTHKEMYNSLNKIKKLPPETKVYCGHENTKSNLDFCLKYDSENSFLKEKKNEIENKLKNRQPTIPTTIEEEIKTNIFLRCNDPIIKKSLDLNNSSEDEVFSRLRDLKDKF